MPEKELLDVFRIKYDYHNIKVLLKAPEGAERLLMDAGTIPAGDLQRQYADSGSWQFLPGDMAAAAERQPDYILSDVHELHTVLRG